MYKPRIIAALAICLVAAVAIGFFNAKQISDTERELVSVKNSLDDLSLGGPLPANSQDRLLTSAVAKTLPSVVSIAVSKNVPDMQVIYINPLDSPLFKDLGIQVPVYIQYGSTTTQKVGAGTGFLISHNGYILTNKHVVDDKNANYTVLLSDGSKKDAKVIYRDPINDAAVVKIEGTYPVVANIGDSSSARLGQTVVAIGNALGEYSNTISVGIISGLNRSIQASAANGRTEDLSNVIQTDASINPGNSGGPLIDLNGNVLGINVATIYGSNNISFAIPINEIKDVIHTFSSI